MVKVLRRYSRCSLDRLPCWSQRYQGYANQDEHSRPDQFSASDHVEQRLKGHYRCVREARPRRKGDQAAVRRGVARRKQQEDAERCVKTHHHRQCGVLLHHQN